MPLILAIERDRHQAARLAAIVRTWSDVELCQARAAADGIRALDGRIPDLVLPSATRQEIRMVTAAGGKIRTIDTLPLPARVVTTIGILEKGTRPSFATGLDDGSLIGITKQ